MCFVTKPFPMNAAARSWENIRKDWAEKDEEH
jgi:hypothetical protein